MGADYEGAVNQSMNLTNFPEGSQLLPAGYESAINQVNQSMNLTNFPEWRQLLPAGDESQ
jgi:hypothetical protein